jgi:Fe-S cluster assembly ATP-binding protein
VHVFANGRIVESGGRELADQLESEGYVKYTGKTEAAALS